MTKQSLFLYINYICAQHDYKHNSEYIKELGHLWSVNPYILIIIFNSL